MKNVNENNVKSSFKDSKKSDRSRKNSDDPFSEFESDKRQMTFEKPFHLGVKNLKLSKLLIYELYYDIMQT